uniref:Uncharacterized protein n=1 Tax=Sphaerodactylus townsendi TaxID=933632 RepID=A0ACB8FF65_9SAUR
MHPRPDPVLPAPGSHVSRTRHQVPVAELKRDELPAQVQTTGLHPPSSPEEAADPGRAAQKERLHAELKWVLHRKAAGRPSSEEATEEPQAALGMEAQLPKMEKATEKSELLEIIVETEAEAGVSGVSVAGGGRQGLFIKDVLKGSPAAHAFSLREGDQLLSARVYFDNMKYEDALQILKSAEPYKVSFCLKRTVPGTDVTRSPGAPPSSEGREPKAKMAKLSIRSLTSLKKSKKARTSLGKALGEAERRGGPEPIGVKSEDVAPVDVEFCLPMFSKLHKARSTRGGVAVAGHSPEFSPLLSSLETKGRKLKFPRLKVEVALPKGSPVGLEAPEEGAFAALKLLAAEVTAPKLEVALSLPRLEGAAPEVALKGEGFQVRVPKVGVFAEETERKLAPLDVVLRKGRGKAEGLEEKGTVPSLGVDLPSVDIEIPLPRGKAPAEAPKPKIEIPDISIKVPPVRLSSRPREDEGESRMPQVELSVGKLESPKAKAKSQALGLGVSLMECVSESKEVASKTKHLALKVPSLDISAPQVINMQLPKALAGLAVPAPGVKVTEATEGPRVELLIPQVSLPKCTVPTKAIPSPPQAPKWPKGDTGGKGSVPTLDLSLPAGKSLEVQFPKGHVPKPELDLCVDRPQVEVALPVARLSFPLTTAPALELDLPRVGIELSLPKVDSEGTESNHTSRDHDAKLKMPPLGTLSRDFEVEISVPQCRNGQSEQQAGGGAAAELDAEAIVARLPKVGLAVSKEESGEAGLVHKGKPESAGLARGGEGKLSSMGVSAIKFPEVTLERGESPETGTKPKSPKFALSKFGISGPKVWKVSTQVAGPDATDKGLKLKMPKFGISFPKSKWGADAEGPKPALEGERKTPRERGTTSAADEEPSERRRQGLAIALPKVGISLATEKAESPVEEGTGTLPELSIELPDIKQNIPKLSLPTFGGKGQEGDVGLERGEAKLSRSRGALTGGRRAKAPEEEEEEAQAKMHRFKLPLFSMVHRDLEEVGLGMKSKAKKAAGAPKEKPRGPLARMAKLKLPSAKADLGHVPVPQVELPKISLPETQADKALLVGSESPKVHVPSLEIAMPGATTQAELTPGRRGAEASEADARERRMPKAPSLDVSAPKVELHLSLPPAGGEAPGPSGVPEAEVSSKLPQWELPLSVRGGAANVQLLKSGGEPGTAGASKMQVAKAQLPDVELFRSEGERVVVGPEVVFRMPSVELPVFSTPKAGAPEQELEGSPEGGKMLPTAKLSSPAIRLPRLRSLDAEGEGEVKVDLPQLELNVPQLGGSAAKLGAEARGKGDQGTLPCPLSGLGLCKAEGEAAVVEEVGAFDPDSKFKLKIPSLSISKVSTEPRVDRQPLCPSPKEEDVSVKMPQIALGFSVDQGGKREAKVEAGKLACAEGLETEGFEGRLKMPKIRIPALGVSIPRGGREATLPQHLDGKRAIFRVPGLELSAPTLKARVEYEVAQAQLEVASRRVRASSDGWKIPGCKGEASDVEAGKKYKVKIPKFGLSMPKAGESILGHEAEAKAKKSPFGLGRSKESGVEGSSGLLEGDEGTEGKGVGGRLRLGLSLSKLKMGLLVVNGELESGASKQKLPNLGFSKGEGGAQFGGERAKTALQNGAEGGKGKQGKMQLPRVELPSPSMLAENDSELSLKLVRAASGGLGPSAALKFKPPQIAFLGFRKRNGEAAPGAVVSSAAQTQMASLKRGDSALKGEKSPKFKFPKVALSPGSHSVLEMTPKGEARAGEAGEGSEQGLEVQLPRVGFSEETGGEGTAAV